MKSRVQREGSEEANAETFYVSTHCSHLFNRSGEQRSVVRRERLRCMHCENENRKLLFFCICC